MTIHREGYPTIIWTLIFLLAVNLGAFFLLHDFMIIRIALYVLSAGFLYIILQFFRHPNRKTPVNPEHIIAPADGKVVVIERVKENEYFNGEERIQLSIFMSPFNVHVNRYPIAGEVKYVKYHPGLYLVAWHPKSSTDNERSTIVVQDNKNRSILFRQVAGALARRIVYYAKAGEQAAQGGECGFIKFGSRVDLYLPLDAEINVQLNQVVTGGESVIATFKS